jgi:hypothetical protein
MMNDSPLTLLEELLLLALDEQTGQLHPLDPDALNCAIAGAVLMDLTLRNRIDNDMRDLFPVDPTPTGDDILDPVLQTLSVAPVLTPQTIAHWLRQLANEAILFREKALRRLEKRGIVHNQSFGIFWVFGPQQSQKIDKQKLREVRSGLLSTITSDDVPSQHGIMLTGLVKSCGLFPYLLTETEAKDARERIEKISRMDLISQAVAKGIFDVKPPPSVVSGNQ